MEPTSAGEITLPRSSDTSKINIANRAVAGRSSRSYYNEGRWDAVVAQLKPGDFVLIQMGHNDGGSGPDGVAKDTKGRASIKGIGEETVDVPIAKPYTTGPLRGKDHRNRPHLRLVYP